jgi:hypothetical protein
MKRPADASRSRNLSATPFHVTLIARLGVICQRDMARNSRDCNVVILSLEGVPMACFCEAGRSLKPMRWRQTWLTENDLAALMFGTKSRPMVIFTIIPQALYRSAQFCPTRLSSSKMARPPEGFDIDLMKAISGDLGLDWQLVPYVTTSTASSRDFRPAPLTALPQERRSRKSARAWRASASLI